MNVTNASTVRETCKTGTLDVELTGGWICTVWSSHIAEYGSTGYTVQKPEIRDAGTVDAKTYY